MAGAATLALVLAGASAPAFAQSTPGTAYFGTGTPNIPLTVPVLATVGGRCGFATSGAPSGNYAIPTPIDTTAWSRQFPFTLECSGPFRIAVVSNNGGLKTTATTDPGYASLAPYDTGGTTTGTCAASSLTSSATTTCALRGTASATVGLPVPNPSYQLSGSYLQVGAPAYAGPGTLIAGTYSDTLVVTVSPSS
jgi:hypothetical protein